MTAKIDNWLQHASNQLREASIDSARLDSILLLEHTLQRTREWILAHENYALSEDQEERLNNYLAQRKERVPLAYILGSKEFYGRSFIVNKDVLIPRPESEAIITLLRSLVDSGQWAAESTATPPVRRSFSDGGRIRNTGYRNDKPQLLTTHYSPLTIYDIGTGSGCLAITIKKELPDTHVIGVDISEKALEVARRNAKELGADVTFLQSDLLSSISDLPSSVFLANLPYVPNKLITSEEITKEPPLALFSGSDGLDHYRTLWQQIDGLQHKPFVVITESLSTQHQNLEVLARTAGYHLKKTTDLIQLFILKSKI